MYPDTADQLTVNRSIECIVRSYWRSCDSWDVHHNTMVILLGNNRASIQKHQQQLLKQNHPCGACRIRT